MNKIIIPEECPFCKTQTRMEYSRLICPNKHCPETLAHKLVAFSERIGVKGLGLENSKLIISSGISNPLDLITAERETLKNVCGKIGENLFEAYQEVRKDDNRISDVKFLNALTIPNVSTHVAELILNKFEISDLYNPFGQLSVDLTTIDGIGSTIQNSIGKFFQENETLINNLQLILNPIHNIVEVNENSQIAGFSVVITGNLVLEDGTKMDRLKFKELLVSNGASLKSSVSKKTNLLVIGDAPGEAKIRDAEEKGVKMVNSKEFLELLKG